MRLPTWAARLEVVTRLYAPKSDATVSPCSMDSAAGSQVPVVPFGQIYLWQILADVGAGTTSLWRWVAASGAGAADERCRTSVRRACHHPSKRESHANAS